MRLDQVPQDNDYLMEGRTRELCYAVDEKGRYVRVLSAGWEPKNAALIQAWEQVYERVKATYDDVLAGKKSPLAFFMAKRMFDVKLLSAYTNMPKRKIKAHLDPDCFRRLDTETLKVYAHALNVTVDGLLNGPRPTDVPFRTEKAGR